MKHNKKAVDAINVICASLGVVPAYSEMFASATASIRGKSGIGRLDKSDLQLVMNCPYFSHVRAGFSAGTLCIEFQTLA